MRVGEFGIFLNTDSNIISKTKAVRSRVSKAGMIERHFDISLDAIVVDDNTTYEILLRIKSEMKDTHGNISNSLRKYYQFVNGKGFPALRAYRK